MARIDDALGHPDAARHRDLAERLAAGMNATLWSDDLGTYVDGLDAAGRPIAHAASHAGAFAAALGVAPTDRAERVAAFLAERGMRTSVYAAPFVLRALVRGGRADAAFALLTDDGERSWRGMIAAGAGATMEAWSERLKPNVSGAHPWAASPLFVVVEELLGIRPLAPGFSEFEIDPALPEELDRLGATVPTAAGAISVDLSRTDGEISARIEVPRGAACVVRTSAGERRLGPGTHTGVVVAPQLSLRGR